VNDDDLRLLSGHRNPDTLLRYLDWGQLSSRASGAARTRTDLIADQVRGAGAPTTHHPMWMGLHSGFAGNSGRRVAKPPQLFPTQAPSRAAITGANTATGESSSWPLHVKSHVTTLDIDAAITRVENADLRGELERGVASRVTSASSEPHGPR
jgi:hypothetical protein